MKALVVNGKQLSIDGVEILGYNDGLPSYTLRLKFSDDVTPTFSKGTAVQVSSSPNIWDLTYESSDWSKLLYNQKDLLEVIDCGDTTGVTKMNSMFEICTSLTSVQLFNTSNVTNMQSMFNTCRSLTTVPEFNTSSVTRMSSMFYGCSALPYVPILNTSNVTATRTMFYNCYNVSGGALALYNQMSTQQNPPDDHTNCFRQCGRDTQTGAAELAQIPDDWK